VGNVLAAVIPTGASILLGGLAMAWRLGSLERTVKDLKEDVDELRRWIFPGRPRDRPEAP
jgi:hypothetical protein